MLKDTKKYFIKTFGLVSMAYKSKTYFVKTYGCQMNVSDSERIAGWYEEKGWKSAKQIKDADEVVVVTCSVRQTAEDRVYGLVNNLAKRPPANDLQCRAGNTPVCKRLAMSGRQYARLQTTCNVGQAIRNTKPKIILTGCMMRYPLRWLREKLPDIDEFKKISEYKNNSQFDNPSTSSGQVLIIRNSQTQAFVSIMEGCNNFCSYCVVPTARGREKSRPFEEIVCEVEELARRGYKEITLLGQNVNSYGNDINNFQFSIFNFQSIPQLSNFQTKFKTPFAILLGTLHQIPEIEKISFLTSNPWDLDDEIIDAMSLPKIDRYLHLPVQSGDDEILNKMNRKYSVDQYLKLIKKIRKKIPDIKIGTDIIVGFPGETEKQFQHTVELCKKIGFTKAYIAMYSPRLQTAAYNLKDDVSHKEKERRWKILDQLINQ